MESSGTAVFPLFFSVCTAAAMTFIVFCRRTQTLGIILTGMYLNLTRKTDTHRRPWRDDEFFHYKKTQKLRFGHYSVLNWSPSIVFMDSPQALG